MDLSIVVNVTLFVFLGLLLSLMLSGFKSRLEDGGNLVKWLLFLTSIALFFCGYYFSALTPLIAAFVSINLKDKCIGK